MHEIGEGDQKTRLKTHWAAALGVKVASRL